MNTYEKCFGLRRIILNRAAEVMNYDNWNDEFVAQAMKTILEDIKEMEDGDEVFDIQPCELVENEMRELGFRVWKDDNPMWLIPLWLYPFLAEDIKTEGINGKKHSKKSEIDNDSRSGCLAYGVIPNG